MTSFNIYVETFTGYLGGILKNGTFLYNEMITFPSLLIIYSYLTTSTNHAPLNACEIVG